MKNLMIITSIALAFSGCSTFMKPTHTIAIDKETIQSFQALKSTKVQSRSEKYFDCIVRLNREGFKQSLIKGLCDSSLGSID